MTKYKNANFNFEIQCKVSETTRTIHLNLRKELTLRKYILITPQDYKQTNFLQVKLQFHLVF